MKLSKYKETYTNYTKQASEISRQLCLAGIAIIWIFKGTTIDNKYYLDPFLHYPLILFSLGLLLDLFQYIVGGYIWKSFFTIEEKKVTQTDLDPDVKDHEDRSKIIWNLYYSKLFIIFIAYVLIIYFLGGTL